MAGPGRHAYDLVVGCVGFRSLRSAQPVVGDGVDSQDQVLLERPCGYIFRNLSVTRSSATKKGKSVSKTHPKIELLPWCVFLCKVITE